LGRLWLEVEDEADAGKGCMVSHLHPFCGQAGFIKLADGLSEEQRDCLFFKTAKKAYRIEE
jgi:hypothetical protein